MKTFFKSLCFILCTAHALAQNSEQIIQLNRDYFAGEFLVYDCQLKAWICTGEGEFQLCQNRHEKDLRIKSPLLSCLPLQGFNDRKTCYQTLKKVSYLQSGELLCHHPDVRDRFIVFQ
jgi:hypothetical protein